MIDPTTAGDVLREHFAQEGSTDRVSVGAAKDEAYTPGTGELVFLPGLTGRFEADPDARLYNGTLRARVPLKAYLASALTGLSGTERSLVFQLSDTVSLVCGEAGIELYEPRKATDPVHHATVPDSEVFHLDRERVIGSDLVIFLSHFPSTGAGEELDIAFNALVPILIVSHESTKVSRMVTGIPGLIRRISYDEPEELRSLLAAELEALRPLLEQRKLALGEYDANIVGDRVRILRQELGLTHEQIAQATSSRAPLTVEFLKRLESSSDRDANPSLLQLRELAFALRTTVADLVEPNLEAIVLDRLSNWVGSTSAARFAGTSVKDRNRILRRLLLRLVDSLENDQT